MKIRCAAPEDAGRLSEIYAYYVEKTAVSFEYAAPSPAEFARRIEATLKNYPFLVLEGEDGAALGYACAGPFKAREAYRRSCEVTVYLDPAARRRGYGRLLYEALEEKLLEKGILNLYACIACPAGETDPFLTRDSELFHSRLGYKKAGTFRLCGYKFGRWYDMIWMEKLIGNRERNEE